MKRFMFVFFFGIFSLSLWAWENQDWIVRDDWYVEMDYNSPNHYDWHDYKTPEVKIRKVSIPAGSALYRRRLRNEMFSYLHQTGADKEHIVFISFHDDGQDDEMEIYQRGDYSYIAFTTKEGCFFTGGDRVDKQRDKNHPLVGKWGELPRFFEFRLVEPANYVYYLDIDREIPSFAVRYGTYFLKQVGDRVFESDSCFPDGRVRVEIKNKQELVFTPLFHLPDETGLVEPFFLKCPSQK